MNLYFNTDSLNFVNSPVDFSAVSDVTFIFGSTQNIGVTLVNASNNGEYVLPPGYNMVLGLKPIGTYLTGNYYAYGSTSAVPNTGAGDYAYNITGFNLYTTGISGLLAQNSNINLAMELEYDINGSGVVLSNPNTCTINNSYINLDQVPFMTGAIAVYPSPDNIQTVSNLGVTYLATYQSGNFYPVSNPSGFIPSGIFVAGSGVQITQSGNSLVIASTGNGGGSSVTTPINVSLTGAYTIPLPSGAFSDGAKVIYRLKQPSTGNVPVALASGYRVPTSSTGLAFSTSGNFMDIFCAMYDAPYSGWDVVSFVPGYH
jgi:hypothetical protein